MSIGSRESELQEIFDQLDERVSAIEALVLTDRLKAPEAIEALSRLANECEQKPFLGVLQVNFEGTVIFCTRIAQIYTRLLTDFAWTPTLPDLILLSTQKRFIVYCFELSGFRSSAALLKQLGLKAAAARRNGKDFASNQAAIRAVTASAISELEAEILVDMSVKPSEVAAVLQLGLLLDRIPITMTGEASRTFLIEECNPFEHLRPLGIYRRAVANVWMLCSYSNSPKKHEIKKHLNQWFKQVHSTFKIKPKPPGSVQEKGNSEQKPVMAVAAESFGSKHAMYRWYAPIIQKLRNQYHMVLVAMAADVDDTAKALFDRFIEIPDEELNIQFLLDQCTPDLVYFPSIGMRSWSISLANLRWGRLQVMSHGHPATTYSDFIDAVFVNSRTFGGTELCSENQLILESEVGSLIEAPKDLTLPPPPELDDTLIRIAIPCNVMKINLHFMAALKEIERLAEKPIRFTFFPNESGLGHLATAKRLQSYFPEADIARRVHYQPYLEKLNQHHFALSPFPFGNATSTIDCLLLGLPVLSMIGEQPHSRSDYDVLSAFNLEDYCVADSAENYAAGAAQWINNPDMLKAMRELVASKDFRNKHFEQENPLSLEFCRALEWAWNNRDILINARHQAFEGTGRWS